MKQSHNALDLEIVDLTHEGLGVGRHDGKVVFVDGALPQERVRAEIFHSHREYSHARLLEMTQRSPFRVDPGCPHYVDCGGCSLQHLSADRQIVFKQKILMDNLERIGKVLPQNVLEPVTGPSFGYRRRARLGVKYVQKKQRLLVGYREKKQSRYLAEIDICMTLDPSVGQKLPQLSQTLFELSCYRQIPQVEITVADNATALVIRHLSALTQDDREWLARMAQSEQWRVYLQSGGPATVTPLSPVSTEALYYRLPEFDLRIEFEPLDFIQVNGTVNKKLMRLAVDLLELEASDRVLDLFCGIGNFSLPLARHAREVRAVEGEQGLVERARRNAALNGLENVRFEHHDLTQSMPFASVDKVLLDPPRSGAQAALNELSKSGAKRMVYVSCNPATLARDAGILCHEMGYQLKSAGVLDMFPHTAHVESIALFEK